jgi:uncharacterized protein
MAELHLNLILLQGSYSLCRFEPDSPVPPWATVGRFTSITRTRDELSIVCPEESVPARVQAERQWRCIKVEGPLDLSLSGIFAALAAQLGAVGVSIFPIATYDTDYLFVKEAQVQLAIETLAREQYVVRIESLE